MTNRGWSSLGAKSYGLERVRYSGEAGFVIKEVRATPEGFALAFTEPVGEAGDVSVSSFTFRYSSAYGSPEIETKVHETTKRVDSDDRSIVHLKIAELRTLYVYEITLDAGWRSANGAKPAFQHCFCTLNGIPPPSS